MTRPRGVEGLGNYWLDHDDGTVERVIVRRGDVPGGLYTEYRFRAPSEAAALELVARWRAANYERITERGRRMARWGPLA